MPKNIGFISTRFAGTDGVTLESSKWAEVLTRVGHRCFWFAGELDRHPNESLLVPEAHFQHPQNRRVDLRLVATRVQDPWQQDPNGQVPYTLWDVYPLADFVTHSSLYEGFGNAGVGFSGLSGKADPRNPGPPHPGRRPEPGAEWTGGRWQASSP